MSITVQTDHTSASGAEPEAEPTARLHDGFAWRSFVQAAHMRSQRAGRLTRVAARVAMGTRRVLHNRFGQMFAVTSAVSFAVVAIVAPALAADDSTIGGSVALLALALHLAAFWSLYTKRKAQRAAVLSSAALTLVCVWAAVLTSGFMSPLIALFVIAPIESLLTRRVLFIKKIAVLTGLGVMTAAIIALLTPVTASLSASQVNLLALGAAIYAVSIAARAAAASAAKTARERAALHAIDQFHSVTHDMFLILQRDGTVEKTFGAVTQIMHCQRDAMVADGFLHRIHVADRPQFLATLDSAHEACGRATVEVRLRVGADASPQQFIWTEIDVSVRRSGSCERDIYALVRDISSAKRRATDLTVAREKAEANDAAKGKFLAAMSHELRTPLNAIIGFADILEAEVFGPMSNEQQSEYVSLIRESGAHLLQLVNDLLDMSKLEAGHFQIVAEPFALSLVTERCTRLMAQQIDKAGLTLKVDVPNDLPELQADQRAVRQILINLLSNAMKFTPAGGSVSLRARVDGDAIVISVSDTGIGISPKDILRLGQPFFQANNAYDRQHQGTGLGLSVVKGLCELHSGSLSFSSVENEGTTVSVRLPLCGPSVKPTNGFDDAPKTNAVVLAKLETQRDAAQTGVEGANLDGAKIRADETHHTPLDAPSEGNMNADMKRSRAYG
ncbi:MAG: PAS domain-containing sensor histidine kinase [Pseudomonadota bacterium]